MKLLKTKLLFFMMKIKRVILFIVAILLCSVASMNAQGNIIDEVVAVVGADPILKSEVEDQYLRMQAEGFAYSGDLKCKILEDMMIQKLLLNQARLDSLEVSESSIIENVDARLNYFISQIGSREKMEEYFGKSSMKIKEDMQIMLREQNLTQQMQSNITEVVTTTPSEIRRYFNTLPDDSIPLVQARYEVQQIQMKPIIEQSEIDRIKDRLRDFRERVNAEGDEFSMLAVLYSQDQNSARRGGELGMMGKGMLVPEFANVAFNLRDPNKVSKIVETEYGYHIMQLVKRVGNRVNVRHILLKPQISTEARTTVTERLDSLAEMIRDEKYTFAQGAMYYSQDKDTRSNGGLLANPATGASTFEITELQQDIAKAVATMNVGDISKPIRIINEREQENYAIISLKSKTEAHRATLKEDYQMLKERVLSEKKEKALKKWIKEQQNETYISIKDDWRNCEYEFHGWVKE